MYRIYIVILKSQVTLKVCRYQISLINIEANIYFDKFGRHRIKALTEFHIMSNSAHLYVFLIIFFMKLYVSLMFAQYC